MKIKNAKISLLIGRDETTIELIDSDSGATFAVVKLTPQQLSSALGRMAYTDCEIEVNGLEKLGKKLETSKVEFEIPYAGYTAKCNYKEIHDLALAACTEGWTPDDYYQGQNSFFTKDGKNFARTTIRRWV